MWCTGQCDCEKIEDRKRGFLERVLSECSIAGGQRGEKSSERPRPYASRKARLRQGEMLASPISGQCRVSCIEGSAWVTCSGRFSDYILKRGESLLLQGEGKIVISGGSDSALVMICNREKTRPPSSAA